MNLRDALIGLAIALVIAGIYGSREKYIVAVGIDNVKSSALGTKREESGIPELDIRDDKRIWRTAEKITTGHDSRNVDFPGHGNN
jgi:hypothetical protein